MRKLITATLITVLSIPVLSVPVLSVPVMTAKMANIFHTGEIGVFSYERIRADSKICIYKYDNSKRMSILSKESYEKCPTNVSDQDLYPGVYRSKDREKR
jgi:hypothetical protein